MTATVAVRRASATPSLWAVLMELLPAALLAALFAAVGVVHVTSRLLVVRTGYQLSELEQQARDLSREHDRLKLELATLKSPVRLEQIARARLGMVPPTPAEVIAIDARLETSGRQGRAKPALAAQVARRSSEP